MQNLLELPPGVSVKNVSQWVAEQRGQDCLGWLLSFDQLKLSLSFEYDLDAPHALWIYLYTVPSARITRTYFSKRGSWTSFAKEPISLKEPAADQIDKYIQSYSNMFMATDASAQRLQQRLKYVLHIALCPN